MGTTKPGSLFNRISFFYGLFYETQKRHFLRVLKRVGPEIGLEQYKTVLDVGCGTGALCAALNQNGFLVTGIDPAEKMLAVGRAKKENSKVSFLVGDATQRLPFHDQTFDLSFASFVAHGMPAEQRKKMYAEMSRVTKHRVIIYDYNRNRAFWTSVIEWIEGGDYFHFIQHAQSELEDCRSQLEYCFSHVEVIQVDIRSAWYVCTPKQKGETDSVLK
jgi:SAM-dependent methyltransferase